jgi:hypothetical protein
VAAASSGGWSSRSRRWGRGRTKNVCLGVGLMLLLGLYLVGPGLDSEPGLRAWRWRDVASIRHGLRLDLHASDSGCSTGYLHGFGSRRGALAAARRRIGEEVAARRGEAGEDELRHQSGARTGRAAASSVGRRVRLGRIRHTPFQK